MLKFGASQHFQEVSHEPPGTERGEKFVGDGGGEGVGVGGGTRVLEVVRLCLPVRVARWDEEVSCGAVVVVLVGGGGESRMRF